MQGKVGLIPIHYHSFLHAFINSFIISLYLCISVFTHAHTYDVNITLNNIITISFKII